MTLKTAILMAPGIGFGWWGWNQSPVAIDIMAAIGVECLFLLLVSLLIAGIQESRARKSRGDVRYRN